MAPVSSDLILTSPSRPFKPYNMSSSPLPSLSELVKKRPPALQADKPSGPLPSNSSAYSCATAIQRVLIPSNEVSVLDTTHSIMSGDEISDAINIEPVDKPLRKRKDDTKVMVESEGRKLDSQLPQVPKDASKTVKPKVRKGCKKRIRDGLENSEDGKSSTTARKPKAKSIEDADINNKITGSSTHVVGAKTITPKPKRKKAKSKVVEKSQMQLPRGKVTKLNTSSASGSKLKEQMSSEAERHSADLCGDGLVDAAKGHLPGTPLSKIIITSDFHENTDSNITPAGSPLAGDNNKVFSDLFGKFGFTKVTAPMEIRMAEEGGTTKRKLIELVDTNVSTLSKSPKKDKAEKKKARTLTDQALSVFSENGKPQPPALSNYLPMQTVQRKTTPKLLNSKNKKPKSSSKLKSKLKDDNSMESILLSPSSAMKQVNQQDFVFGTSSQLAQEDSPKLHQGPHEAMQESNRLEDPFASSPTAPSSLRVIKKNRNLWTAASRDIGGSLLDVEIINLSESPVASDMLCTTSVPTHDQWHEVGSSPIAEPDYDLPIIAYAAEKALKKLPVVPVSLLNGDIGSTKTTRENPQSSVNLESDTRATEKMPNFDSYTNAQLAKEITTYHFKPVKKREQMIALLQQCWEGKQRIKLGILSTNTIINAKTTTDEMDSSECFIHHSPKRSDKKSCENNRRSSSPGSKLNRSKSNVGLEYLKIDSKISLTKIKTPKKLKRKTNSSEETSNSDTHCTPPSFQGKPIVWSPNSSPCVLNSEETESSSELSPNSSCRPLFSHITQAIKTINPSKDSSKPSWHEKILLYDPIVLEDLTAWLNTGALQKTNWDREVEPKEVKKWCESRSICCLWRENLNSGSRNRY